MHQDKPSKVNPEAPTVLNQPPTPEDTASSFFHRGMIIDNQYKVMGILGKGGMGIVLRVEDLKLKREAALKTLLPGFTPDNLELRRFGIEAESLAQIESPHVAQVFAYSMNGFFGRPYLVMELVKGRPLDDILKEHHKFQRPFEKQSIAKIIYEISEGLQIMHANGIIHRDIKPANLIVEEKSGLIKIIDLGAAKNTSKDSLTSTGAQIGTVSYMSPEQAMDSKHVDKRCDVYALGQVAYQLIAREPNFVPSGAMISNLAKKINEPARSIKDACPDMEHVDAVDAVLKNTLSIDPNERPDSAKEFAVQFGRALMYGEKPGDEEKKNNQKKRRNKIAAYFLSAAAAVSMALGGVAIVISNKKSNDQPTPTNIVQPEEPRIIKPTTPKIDTPSQENKTKQSVRILTDKSYNRLEVIARQYQAAPGEIYEPKKAVFIQNDELTQLPKGAYQLQITVDNKTFFEPFMMPENADVKTINIVIPDQIPTGEQSHVGFQYIAEPSKTKEESYLGTKEITYDVILTFIQESLIAPKTEEYKEIMIFLHTHSQNYLQGKLNKDERLFYLQKYAEWYAFDNEFLRRSPSVAGPDQRRVRMFDLLVENNIIPVNEFRRYNPLVGIFNNEKYTGDFNLYINFDEQKMGKQPNLDSLEASGIRALTVQELNNWNRVTSYVRIPGGYELIIPPPVELLERAASGDGLYTFMNAHQLTNLHQIIDIDNQRDYRPFGSIQGDVSPHGVQGLLTGTEYAKNKEGDMVIMGWTPEGYRVLKTLDKREYDFLSPSTTVRFALVKKE